MNNLCNCGQPIRYSHGVGGESCNKYFVCPTYEELRKERYEVRQLNGVYLAALTKIHEIDEDDHQYKTWARQALKFGEELCK